jgi:hypothetical protein
MASPNPGPIVALLTGAILVASVQSLGPPERREVHLAHASPVRVVDQNSGAAAIYDDNPRHLWNRLHEALFVRIGNNGEEYGRDRLEPLLWRGSRHLLAGESHDRLIRVLDEFNKGGESLIANPVKRAMLQRDLWLVFSWLESSHNEFYGFGGGPEEWRARQERLRTPLAHAIGRVAASPAEIAALPDTFAAAVAASEFAPAFDPTRRAQPYLPADLYAPEGPWVSLGRRGDLVARAHVLSDNPFTNSAFVVFINLPGGRADTLAYVERLGAFKGPLFVATPSSPTPVFPHFNPAIPQFPGGTKVALVRRAMLVTKTLEVVATPLTENLQVRVYRKVPPSDAEFLSKAMLITDEVRSWQSASEFVLSRRRLFAGRSGGLRAVGDDNDFVTGFSTHGVDPFEAIDGEAPEVTAARPMGALGASLNTSPERHRPRRIDRCAHCHQLPGVYSFNTFAQNFAAFGADTPKPLSAMPVSEVLASAIAWKRGRADWVLLRRLLAPQ